MVSFYPITSSNAENRSSASLKEKEVYEAYVDQFHWAPDLHLPVPEAKPYSFQPVLDAGKRYLGVSSETPFGNQHKSFVNKSEKGKGKKKSKVESTEVSKRWGRVSSIFDARLMGLSGDREIGQELENMGPPLEKMDDLVDFKISCIAFYMISKSCPERRFEELLEVIKTKSVQEIISSAEQDPGFCFLIQRANEMKLSSDKKEGISDPLNPFPTFKLISLENKKAQDLCEISENETSDQKSEASGSDDRIASSSEGSSGRRSRRKKKSLEASDKGKEEVSSASYIFSANQDFGQELPYMAAQRNAEFRVVGCDFCLCDEEIENLTGQRDKPGHFVDLQHVNQAMTKILSKPRKFGDNEYTFKIDDNKYLRVIVRKFSDRELVLLTNYYMTASKVKKEFRSEVQFNLKQFPRLSSGWKGKQLIVMHPRK